MNPNQKQLEELIEKMEQEDRDSDLYDISALDEVEWQDNYYNDEEFND